MTTQTTQATTLTASEWKEIADGLQYPGHQAKILADDHEITIESTIYKNRIVYSIFIDGWIKGEYCNEESPFSKYLNKKRTQYPSPAKLNKMKVGLSKKFIKQNPDLFKAHVVYYYTPMYSSVRAIQNRLSTTCSSITKL